MDYEKKYKEALERAKEYLKEYYFEEAVKEIFPELKEPEDEKVRKALIEMVHDINGNKLRFDYNVHKEEALAWLEKQGEQKPFDYEHANIQQKDFAPKDSYAIKENGSPYPTKPAVFSEKKPKRMISAEVKEAMYDKPAWSEEDEKMVDNILTPLATRYPFDIYQPMYNWLKSLKERIGG